MAGHKKAVRSRQPEAISNGRVVNAVAKHADTRRPLGRRLDGRGHGAASNIVISRPVACQDTRRLWEEEGLSAVGHQATLSPTSRSRRRPHNRMPDDCKRRNGPTLWRSKHRCCQPIYHRGSSAARCWASTRGGKDQACGTLRNRSRTKFVFSRPRQLPHAAGGGSQID